MKRIPVVFGIDKTYILQTFVVINSILRNSMGKYHFFILTKDDIELEVTEMSKYLIKYYPDFLFSIQKVEKKIFTNIKIYNSHLTEAAFYRLLIPMLVMEYEKCIYLDCDVLVNGDLQELFAIELGQNYLGGVKDCHLISKYETRHQKYLGISSVENYINSGVLLMNLKKMREDNQVSAFLAQAEKENLFEDQDVLNLCCYGFIKILPLKYNLFHFYQGRAIKKLFDLPYKSEEFLFDWENPFILHMGGQFKPWINKRYKGAKKWWDLAEIYRNSEAYQNCAKECKTGYGEKEEIEGIFDKCRNKARIVLWGYSNQGRDVCELFLRKNIKVYSFCDNNRKLEGMIYNGVPVRNLRELIDFSEETFWIITCKKAYKAVYDQLLEAGIGRENIVYFTYNNKGKAYYLALNKDYYEEELKIISFFENDGKLSEGEHLKYIREVITEADIQKRTFCYLYYKYRFDLWLMN